MVLDLPVIAPQRCECSCNIENGTQNMKHVGGCGWCFILLMFSFLFFPLFFKVDFFKFKMSRVVVVVDIVESAKLICCSVVPHSKVTV